MTKKFEASNGVVIDVSGRTTRTVYDGMRQARPGGADVISRTSYLNAREFAALREFFRHERDEELGRWRDPMSPEVVVTEIDHGRVHVYNEATRWYSEFDSAGPDRVHLLTSGDYGLNWPAIRYFTAHPVAKPWHDAKPGEVWIITDDRQKVFEMTVVEGSSGLEFFTHHRLHATTYVGITAARRIWPEVSNA